MTGFEIADLLVASGIVTARPIILDDKYRLPDYSWVTSTFASKLRKFQNDLHLNRWTEVSNDCDDFSEDARFLMRKLHRNTHEGNQYGIAFGIIAYQADVESPNKELGHELNFFISIIDGKPTLNFFEPQTGLISNLSVKERQNTYYYLV